MDPGLGGPASRNTTYLDNPVGERLWRYRAGVKVNPSPVVSGGAVYARSFGGAVHAMDAASGTPLWERNPGGHYLLSSLVLSDSAVHVESFDDRSVYGLDTVTGALLWRYRTRGEPHSPASFEGVAYTQSSDGASGYVAALDAANGQVLWEYRTGTTGDGGTADHPPVVSGGAVYVVTGGYLDAVDTVGGELRWRYEPGLPGVYLPMASGGVVYVRSEGYEGGYLDALDASTGARKWRYEGTWSCTPAVFGGRVYVGGFGGEVHAVDVATGGLHQRYTTGSGYVSSITVSGSIV